MSESKKTTDRNAIKRWAEDRKGVPAKIKGTESGGGGVLRIHFPQASEQDENFEQIDWDKFFDIFEQRKLAMLYQEEKDNGEPSTFHKIVNR